jgi:hypothetical protein
MMTFSILTTCVLVPLGFMSRDPFSNWLKSVGVHMSPNLADGYPIAEFSGFERSLRDLPPGADASAFDRALALRSFSVKKVAFRRFSGMGIAPRVNLSFEFDGRLPDPQNSPRGFSMTTIHVYIKAPARQPDPVRSERAAKVDFGSPGWNYQVLVDGFHEQARIFDAKGNLVASGLGLYIDYQKKPGAGAEAASGRTRLTAALPMDYLGDPAQGDWQFYVLVGISDSRHPSMMLHSAADTRPSVYCAALAAALPAAPEEKPRLRALALKKPL